MKLLLSGFFCLIASVQLFAGQCGTAILFNKQKTKINGAFKIAKDLRTTAVENRARTLVTEHFLIHYSLRGIHKVHTEADDSVLMHQSDSLYKVFATLPPISRDSAVYLHLDEALAPHPSYIKTMQTDLEGAWKYYVDVLGMLPPRSSLLSVHYKVSVNLPHRFPIDVVDVGTVDAAFAGETYAVTYPPDRLSITFENDFLWSTKLNTQGIILGDSIRSQLNGKVIHNYAKEWALGVKVTAYHEFYHAIQFTYNPNVSDYHAWYEISATGMEERNAPEINDYLQYLPCVLYNHESVGLLSTETGPCTHAPMYGQSIFHQYLSQKLDSTFDVKVWEALSQNGDNISQALNSSFAQYGQTMSGIYSAYTQQLFFSGNQFNTPMPLFSSDQSLWPRLTIDSLDLTDGNHFRQITIQPLTFYVLKVEWNAKSVEKFLFAHGAVSMTQFEYHSNGYSSLTLPDSSLNFDLKLNSLQLSKSSHGFYLLVANNSYTDPATIEIKTPETEFFAFPNPIETALSKSISFSQIRGSAFPAHVEIFGESGKLLRTLTFPTFQSALVWDLKDGNGKQTKPGIYYYRFEKSKLLPLVILR